MAEVVAIGSFAVSALALATEGLKIAEDLKTFVDRFNEAPEDLTTLSSDVRITSKTIEELGTSLKSPRSSQVVKEEWYVDTQTHVSDCTIVFEEIKTLLSQYQRNGSDTNSGLSKRQRLKFVWNYGRITRFRTRIQHLQNSFSFRLAVFQFSSNAIDRQTKAQEREQAKVLNQLHYEQALLGLQIAYVRMNEEHTVKDNQNDDTSNQTGSKPGLARTISSPLCLPASPNGFTSMKASTSTLVNSTGEASDRRPRTRRWTGPVLLLPSGDVPELVPEDSADEDSILDNDEPSEDEMEVPQASNQVISPDGSKLSPEPEARTLMEEQLFLLTHLVEELTVRFDKQPSRSTKAAEDAHGVSVEQSVDTQASTMEAMQIEMGASDDFEAEKPKEKSQTAQDAAQVDDIPADFGTHGTMCAGSMLRGNGDAATVETTDTVDAENGDEALKLRHTKKAYVEDAHDEDAESGVLEVVATHSCQGTSGRPDTGVAKAAQDGVDDDETAGSKTPLQLSVDMGLLELRRAGSSQRSGLLKERASSPVSSSPPTIPAAPTDNIEASQKKVMVIDTGHGNGLLKSIKDRLFGNSGDQEDRSLARREGPTFQRPSEPAGGPLLERLEAWSIHCNEAFRRFGQVDRAWNKARVQYMPVASDDLSKEIVDRRPHQSVFDELAELPCSAREQIMDLLLKRWEYDTDLELDDKQCGWTLTAIVKRPPDASKKTLKALHLIIQRVWTPSVEVSMPPDGYYAGQTTPAGRRADSVKYTCWHFENENNDWETVRRREISMRQSDMGRMVKSQRGLIPYDLGDSGTCRAAQVDHLVQDQNAKSDRLEWEVAYIDTTNPKTRPLFEGSPETMTIILEGKPRQDNEQHELRDTKQERKQKSKQEDIKDNPLYDPFGESILFHPTGKPMDGRGNIEFSNAGLPTEIPRERPIGAQPQAASRSSANHKKESLLGDSLVDILDDIPEAVDHTTSKDSKGASTVHFGPDRYYPSSSSRRSKSRSKRRRYYDDNSDSDSSEDSYYGRDGRASSRSHRRNKSSTYDLPYSSRRSIYNYPSRSRRSTYDYPSLSRRAAYDTPDLSRRSTYDSPNEDRQSGYYDDPENTSRARNPSLARSSKSQAMPEESNKALSKILDKWMPMGSQAMDMNLDGHPQFQDEETRLQLPPDLVRVPPRYYDNYPNARSPERDEVRERYAGRSDREEDLAEREREVRQRQRMLDEMELSERQRRRRR